MFFCNAKLSTNPLIAINKIVLVSLTNIWDRK